MKFGQYRRIGLSLNLIDMSVIGAFSRAAQKRRVSVEGDEIGDTGSAVMRHHTCGKDLCDQTSDCGLRETFPNHLGACRRMVNFAGECFGFRLGVATEQAAATANVFLKFLGVFSKIVGKAENPSAASKVDGRSGSLTERANPG